MRKVWQIQRKFVLYKRTKSFFPQLLPSGKRKGGNTKASLKSQSGPLLSQTFSVVKLGVRKCVRTHGKQGICHPEERRGNIVPLPASIHHPGALFVFRPLISKRRFFWANFRESTCRPFFPAFPLSPLQSFPKIPAR